MRKITKRDLKKNKYNIFLSMLYSSILAIVYSTWFMHRVGTIYITVLIAVAFVIAGIIVAYKSTVTMIENESNNKEETYIN